MTKFFSFPRAVLFTCFINASLFLANKSRANNSTLGSF